MQIARFPKENGSRARTVVITQGKDPTVIASNGKVRGSCRIFKMLGLSGRSVCLSMAHGLTLAGIRMAGAALSVTVLRESQLATPVHRYSRISA